MKIAIGQIAPKLLDRETTLEKVVSTVEQAGREKCGLVAFGEGLVPGYPCWLSSTGGARFNDPDQKALHALYVEQAVDIERGDLDDVCRAAREGSVAVVLGVIERVADRGRTLYCTRVFIGANGEVLSTHRKLMPTYEERLAWGPGDGAGLVTHPVGPFTVGALNCWENWMPLTRAALYAAGEDLHVMIWPGSVQLTQDLTRFVAREGRVFVISASGLLRDSDLPADLPLREAMAQPGQVLQNGGSCVAGPDGEWILEPVANEEGLLTCELDPSRVAAERQNFDPAGHYARPDVLKLTVDRRRQTTVDWVDDA